MTTDARERMQRAIEQAINCSSGENDSNTPDYILAQFLMDCFDAFTLCSRTREKWYGKSLSIGGGIDLTVAEPPAAGGDADSAVREAIHAGRYLTTHPVELKAALQPPQDADAVTLIRYWQTAAERLSAQVTAYACALVAGHPAAGGERTCETCEDKFSCVIRDAAWETELTVEDMAKFHCGAWEARK